MYRCWRRGGRGGAGIGTSQAGFTANLVLPSAQKRGISRTVLLPEQQQYSVWRTWIQLPAPTTPQRGESGVLGRGTTSTAQAL